MQIQLVLNGHVVDAEVDAVDLANAVVALLNGDASNRAFTEAFEAVDQKTITDGTATFMPQVPVGYERFQEQTPFLLKGTSITFNTVRHGIRPMQELVTTPEHNGRDDTEYHVHQGLRSISMLQRGIALTQTNMNPMDSLAWRKMSMVRSLTRSKSQKVVLLKFLLRNTLNTTTVAKTNTLGMVLLTLLNTTRTSLGTVALMH